MSDRRNVLTPEALTMVDLIARTGSFAAAARELGKVPSALTYSVRQLEDALDVLLFDRSSRQAKLTAAGEELLHEGRRLLLEIDAVANRVKRVATGWETQLTVAVDNILAPTAVFELVEAFYTLRVATRNAPDSPPPTRLRLRSEVLSGTWEVLATGRADLAIGIAGDPSQGSSGIRCEPLGNLDMRFAVAPHHALAAEPEPLSAETIAQHRVVAIADSAHSFAPMTLGVQPGQDVLTVPSLAAKLEAPRPRPGLRLDARAAAAPACRSRPTGDQADHAADAQPRPALRLACAGQQPTGPGLAMVAVTASQRGHAASAVGTARRAGALRA